MKLSEAIKKLDKSLHNEQYVALETLCEECSILYCLFYAEEDIRIKSYWLTKHFCTDTWVGIKVFFLDDTPVCISSQKGRKCSEDFYWFSEEAYDKVSGYLLSLLGDEKENISTISLDLDIEEGYQVEYSQELLTDKVIYIPTNEKVTITCKWTGIKHIDSWRRVVILFDSGKRSVVSLSDILVPYCLKEEE